MEFNKMIDVVIFCILVEICRHVKMGDLITFEVKECPQNQSKWDEAALRLNCSVDRHGQNTYHCVPNQDKTSLVEFCYNRLIGRFQEGYCLQLTKTLFLHSDICLNILPGCPAESYLSNTIFKYPECQHINTKSRCYITDEACWNKMRDFGVATTQRKTIHNSSYEQPKFNSTTPFISKEVIYPLEQDYNIYLGITVGICMSLFVLKIACNIIKEIRTRKQKSKAGKEEVGECATLNLINDKNDEGENIHEEKSKYCRMDAIFKGIDKRLLHFLLCMDKCSADLKDPQTINRLIYILGLYSFDMDLKTGNYISIFQCLEGYEYVQINDSVVTLRDGVKGTVVRYINYCHLIIEDRMLAEWNIDILKQYVRIQPYQRKAGEDCIVFPQSCIDRLIRRLNEHILTHPIVEEKSFHQKIAEKLKIPEEILKMDAESRERYEKYLQLDKREVYRARAMFVGCARAGKTTIIKRLLNYGKAQIQENTDSTVGLEVHDHVLTVDEENNQLKGNDGASTSVINDSKLLSLVDFAGQSAYYACHQVYLSYRAFYCLVVDMTKDLNDKIAPDSCEANGTVFQNWTYKDYFLFWLKSIHTYCSRRSAGADNEGSNASDVPVILIVTHCEGKSDKEIEQYFHDLIGCLSIESNLKKYLNTTRYCSFSFDYEEGNDHQRRKLESVMIKTIKSQSHWGEEIPASWAEFERYVEKEKKEQKQKLITLPELRTQGSKIGLLNEEEIHLLLSLFHEMGLILNFSEASLRETIILDIQWFVDAFKNIISDQNHVHNAADNMKEYARLMENGELNVDLLLKIWNGYPKCCFREHKDYILPYMQRLGLLAGCRDRNGKNIYYLPSMNRKEMEKKDMRIIECAPKKTSLLIFKFDFLPYFVFYRLVVSCIEKYGYVNSDNKTCFYHSMAIFYHQYHFFGIAVTENSIRVQIFKGQSKLTTPKLSSKMTLKIRDEIEEMLTHLTRTFHSSLHYTAGYNCRMKDICENDEGEEFIAESVLTKDKEQICPNHGFGDTQHYLEPKKFIKYWRKDSLI